VLHPTPRRLSKYPQVEEEEYATRYIHYFSSGLLSLPEGRTLRASLAEKLHCDPMRITKKYAGASCLGSKISKLTERPRYTPRDVELARMEIARLDRRFRVRLAQGVGVQLPPDDCGEMESSTIPTPGDAPSQSIDGLHANASNGGGSSFVHHVGGAPDGVHLAALSHHMTMPSASSSYLANVVPDNAQIAAATVAPNISPIMVTTAPSSAPPTHVVVQRQAAANSIHGNAHQSASQQAAISTSAMNWPAIFQGANQVDVHNAATRSDRFSSIRSLLCYPLSICA
jgi:hypothetical protein